MKTSGRFFAGVELGVIFALWFLTVWGAWRWTGASIWTAGGFLTIAGIVAVSASIRKPGWKALGFRVDNLRPASMEVGLISFALVGIFFLLIRAQGIPFQPASGWRGVQLVASGVLQEAFFLGYLFYRWNALLQNPVGAVAANAASFGLIHLPHISLTFLTALGGVVLGILFVRSRNVWSVGLAHGLIGALIVPTLQFAGPFATTQIGPPELFPLAMEIAYQLRPDDRIGIGPHGIAPAHLGHEFSVQVERVGDAAAGEQFNRDQLRSFLQRGTRVFCLLSEEDLESYVKPSLSQHIFVLGQRYIWKRRFSFDRQLLQDFFRGSADIPVLGAFRQRVFLISNRPGVK